MSASDMANKVGKPDHVPGHLVYEFDYNTDPEYCRDPHARAADLMANAPAMFWTPFNGGHWIFQSHDAVSEALRDYAAFSSEHFSPKAFEAMMAELPESERIPAPVPICIDPPLHAKLRHPLFSTFSPKAVQAMETKIRALAERLVDGIAAKGRCEFQHDIADVYPVELFLEMFGLPVEKERDYRELAKRHLTTISPDLAANMMMMQSIASVMRDTIIERQTQPRNDIISLLWSLEIEGEPMTLDLMLSYCVILFIAGLDTVVNALGFGVRHLAVDTPLQQRLRADPSLIPLASEELLRRYAFVAPIRIMKKDTTFRGLQLKEGERVMLFIPSASVDASVYAEPTTFDPHRERLTHLAFGAGPHHCLGANLARLELKVMYETLLNKLPEFRLDATRPSTFHGSIIAGPKTIHLVWGSGVHAAADNVPLEPIASAAPIEVPAPTIAAASPSAATSAAGKANGASDVLEGAWSITIHGPTGPQETLLELRRKDATYAGTQSALGQVEEVLELSFDARSGKIAWVNKISKPLPLKLKFEGVIAGNAMNGKVKASIMGSFPFTGLKKPG